MNIADTNFDFPTFGYIENGVMILNEYGHIAYDELKNMPKRFANVSFDIFQIMPDHVHVIIEIQKNELIKIGQIVGAYKSLVVKKCLDYLNSCRGDPRGRPLCVCGRPEYKFDSKGYDLYKLWQRNFYERIIRNEQEYQTISKYISDNPVHWKQHLT
jgi:REP element-mobilizing transposase RayT